MSGYERDKRKVLRRCSKTTSDCTDVTWNGRSFHMLAPATGNARLPTVESRTSGASRREAEDRSRRLDVMSTTRVKHDCR